MRSTHKRFTRRRPGKRPQAGAGRILEWRSLGAAARGPARGKKSKSHGNGNGRQECGFELEHGGGDVACGVVSQPVAPSCLVYTWRL